MATPIRQPPANLELPVVFRDQLANYIANSGTGQTPWLQVQEWLKGLKELRPVGADQVVAVPPVPEGGETQDGAA